MNQLHANGNLLLVNKSKSKRICYWVLDCISCLYDKTALLTETLMTLTFWLFSSLPPEQLTKGQKIQPLFESSLSDNTVYLKNLPFGVTLQKLLESLYS